MRKVFFIMMVAIAGSFGLASAQVEQSTTTESQGTTYQKETTSPNKKDTTRTEIKKQSTQKKSQSTYQNQGTSTKTQGSSTSKTEGSSGTGSTTGTGSSTGSGTYQQGTGSTGTGTGSGTYQQGTGSTGTGTTGSGTYQQGTGSTGTGTTGSGTYQQGTGSTGTGTGSGTYQQGTGSTGTGTGSTGTGTGSTGTGTGSGTYQQGTGSTGTGTTGSGTYQQDKTKSQQDKTKTQGTYDNRGTSMSQDDKGWTKIGEKTVDLSDNNDEIAVRGSEKFSSIKLKVTDASMIELEDVQVEYEGGEKQAVEMDTPLNTTTGESEIIQLDSDEKNLKKITFEYKTRAVWKDNKDLSETKDAAGEVRDAVKDVKNSKAKVEVWGLKSDTAQR